MLNFLKKEASVTFTENGAKTFSTTSSDCLDLFFKAGAMRYSDETEICDAVSKAFTESPDKTMKIIFFARDVRGGLGERRFFRIAVKFLADSYPESVKKNIPYIAEYGRYDDLCTLIDTNCCDAAVMEVKRVLAEDISAMEKGENVTLLAKWLPSVNASSAETLRLGKKLCRLLGMSEREYRRNLSSLRKYIDITENYLRERDYTFDYSKQPSGAMLKYKDAFIRNDGERYISFLKSVEKGQTKLNASTLYPYEIVREIFNKNGCGRGIHDTAESRKALDVTWKNLMDYGNNEENSNAIAVIDGSGSMTCGIGTIRPIDAALSLGLYFAEHNKGKFANHFITFSMHPQLVEIKGSDITEKVLYCANYNEVANTDIKAVFDLILRTAVKNKLPQSEVPSRMYIISDMEFDYCVEGGNKHTTFEAMAKKYSSYGYKLPDIVFWNVNSRNSNFPVKMSDTGAALVSGNSPAIFDMVKSGDISPEKIMNDIIFSERYEVISA